MKKIFTLILSVAVVTLTLQCQNGSSAKKSTTTTAGTSTNNATSDKISIQYGEIPSFSYMAMEGKGSPMTEMGKVMPELLKNAMAQGIITDQWQSMPFSVYHNNPQLDPDNAKWDVGAKIKEGTKLKAPLMMKTYDGTFGATATHFGDYSDLGHFYEKLVAQITKDGYDISFPSYEMYLDDPEKVEVAKIRTEIFLPVKKK